MALSGNNLHNACGSQTKRNAVNTEAKWNYKTDAPNQSPDAVQHQQNDTAKGEIDIWICRYCFQCVQASVLCTKTFHLALRYGILDLRTNVLYEVTVQNVTFNLK